MGSPEQPRDRPRSGAERAQSRSPDEPGAGRAGINPPGVTQRPGGYVPRGYSYGPPPPRPEVVRTNGLSVAALVCGLAQFLLWFFLLVPGFVTALLALSFGLGGLAQIRNRGDGGRGLAIAGIVLGGLGVLAGIAWAILLGLGSTSIHYHAGA